MIILFIRGIFGGFSRNSGGRWQRKRAAFAAPFSVPCRVILTVDVVRVYGLFSGCTDGQNHDLITSNREESPVFSLRINPEKEVAKLLGKAGIFVGQAT